MFDPSHVNVWVGLRRRLGSLTGGARPMGFGFDMQASGGARDAIKKSRIML